MSDDLDGPTRPGVPFDADESEDGPTLEVHLDDTRTLPRRRVPDPDDLAETLTVPRRPSIDEVATTELSPIRPQRFEPAPVSEQTRPFLLAGPTETAPFPLVPRAGAPLAPPSLPPAPAAPRPSAGKPQRALLAFAAALLGTLALALVVSVTVVALRRVSPEAPRTASTQAPSSTAAIRSCSLELAPTRLAARVVGTVLPIAAPALAPGEVAVGFSDGERSALGIVVDTGDLSVERRFAQRYTRPVFRVTPAERDGSLSFLVDHDSETLQMVRSVPARTPFVIGVSYSGIARSEAAGAPEKLWSGGKGASIGEPAFAKTADGWAVAFSRERALELGWLSDQGQARGELALLPLPGIEASAVRMAASPDSVALAIAVREAHPSTWRILLARSAPGEAPRKLEPFAEGAGPDRAAPALAPIPGGGFLLSWVEGSEQRHVRAQVLSEQLLRVGTPIEISNAPGIEPLAGTLQQSGERVLSLHLRRTERSTELWGAVLRCG